MCNAGRYAAMPAHAASMLARQFATEACSDLHPGLCRTADKDIYGTVLRSSALWHAAVATKRKEEAIGTCWKLVADLGGDSSKEWFQVVCNVRYARPAYLACVPLTLVRSVEMFVEVALPAQPRFITCYELLKQVFREAGMLASLSVLEMEAPRAPLMQLQLTGCSRSVPVLQNGHAGSLCMPWLLPCCACCCARS